MDTPASSTENRALNRPDLRATIGFPPRMDSLGTVSAISGSGLAVEMAENLGLPLEFVSDSSVAAAASFMAAVGRHGVALAADAAPEDETTAAPTTAAPTEMDVDGSPAPPTLPLRTPASPVGGGAQPPTLPADAVAKASPPPPVVAMASPPGLHPSPATQAQESLPAGAPQQLPGATVAAAEPAVPVALAAPAAPGARAAPGAPSEESQEVTNSEDEVDFGGDEEMSPSEAAPAGEDEEAGIVLKDCWDRGRFWVKRPVISQSSVSQSSASHHSATSQSPVWRKSAI